MKKPFLFILSFCLCVSVSAQKVYFIYLETDNNSPFYVRMGDRVFSSSAPGYLVLPNLVDSSYTLFVGLSSTGVKEVKFEISLKGSDRGFSIRNSEGGLNLFDLQNLILIKPVQDPTKGNISYEARSDAFTTLLSKASGDSSLLLAPIFAKAELPKKQEKEPDAVTRIQEIKPKAENIKSDTAEIKPKTEDIALMPDTGAIKPKSDSAALISAHAETVNAGHKEERAEVKYNTETTQSQNKPADSIGSTQPETEYKRSTVKKHAESSTSEGFGLVFIDQHDEIMDTIRLTIPNPKIIFRNTDTVKQDNNMFLDRDSLQQALSNKNAVSATKDSVTVYKDMVVVKKEASAATIPLKAKCNNQATENDFFKLRKNMASKETDESMVDEAKKFFKSKCFTTEQVKYLSALFLTSAGKYQFFDAAYMHVSDPEQFASLQSEIKDDYYLRRFKALIGE